MAKCCVDGEAFSTEAKQEMIQDGVVAVRCGPSEIFSVIAKCALILQLHQSASNPTFDHTAAKH